MIRNLLTLAGMLLVLAIHAAPRAANPNIVILFTDDMGYGDLGCYGHPVIRTPNIDRMAAEGIRLTSFYCAAPVCSPSRAGLLTGRYPVHAGMPGNTGPTSDKYMPLDQIIIPKVLKGAGYRTMAIGKWHLGHQIDEALPTGRGFDAFFGLPYSNDMIRPWVNTDKSIFLYSDTTPVEEMPDQRFLTTRYTARALEFINSSARTGDPFFLYLAYSMPHLPINTTDERRGRSPAGLYGDVIETIDWSAGEILNLLKDLNLDMDTLVVFASDNGPWQNLPDRMLQQGNEPWHAGLAGHLSGSKGTTYEGGLRVPGIFRWPGRIPAGRTSHEIAATIDIFPTLMGITGTSVPAGYDLDGFDLFPFLSGKTDDSPRDEYLYWFKGFEAIRVGPWKYRFVTTRKEAELFHLERDPAEKYNVIDRYPDIAEKLHNTLVERARHYDASLRGKE